MRPVELVLPPKAEAVLGDEALTELHPKTGPPQPQDRQLVLPQGWVRPKSPQDAWKRTATAR